MTGYLHNYRQVRRAEVQEEQADTVHTCQLVQVRCSLLPAEPQFMRGRRLSVRQGNVNNAGPSLHNPNQRTVPFLPAKNLAGWACAQCDMPFSTAGWNSLMLPPALTWSVPCLPLWSRCRVHCFSRAQQNFEGQIEARFIFSNRKMTRGPPRPQGGEGGVGRMRREQGMPLRGLRWRVSTTHF